MAEKLLWLLASVIVTARPCCGVAISGDGGPPLPSGSTGSHIVRLTDDSHIRGFQRSVLGRTIWNFLGIPYARPPVGKLRFRAPVPLSTPVGASYREPFNAYYKPPSCYSWPTSKQEFEMHNPALLIWWNNTVMSEDCLYLNVWTPSVNQGDNKAIMVWIFGGGFYGGSASLEIYDGSILASKGDVIVASMQYRTGALGFMHLDAEESPGNMGLMDQRLAMKWIWTNARYFGGDPSRVTIFGESAGAVSVSYHMLLPESQKYFSRAILNSGSALAYWASEDQVRARYRSYNLADLVNCYQGDGNRKRIVDCMRAVTAERIQESLFELVVKINRERVGHYNRFQTRIGRKENMSEPLYFFYLPFRPVYGTDFIPEDPRITVRTEDGIKKTDMLLGVVKNEGIFWIVYALSQFFIPKNQNQNQSNWHLPFWWASSLNKLQKNALEDMKASMRHVEVDPPLILAKYFMASQNLNPLIIDSVSFEYQLPSNRFGFRHWSSKDVLDAIDALTGDNTFKCPVIDFAEYYLRFLERKASLGNNVWMYSFEHRTQSLTVPEWTGAMHGYELDYVFGMPFNENFTRNFFTYTPPEEELSKDMIKFWSNFAKTGNPNQPEGTRNIQEHIMTWPPYRIGNRSHIVLDVKQGPGSYRVGENLRRRQCNFWSAQMRNIREYMQRSAAVPCIREPKKSTQSLTLASPASAIASAVVVGLLSLTALGAWW